MTLIKSFRVTSPTKLLISVYTYCTKPKKKKPCMRTWSSICKTYSSWSLLEMKGNLMQIEVYVWSSKPFISTWLGLQCNHSDYKGTTCSRHVPVLLHPQKWISYSTIWNKETYPGCNVLQGKERGKECSMCLKVCEIKTKKLIEKFLQFVFFQHKLPCPLHF